VGSWDCSGLLVEEDTMVVLTVLGLGNNGCGDWSLL
jgi:hypothetical protein